MNISVIIPVFNAERFVDKAIRSACEQSEVSEIIIVEDNSADASLEKCLKLTNEYPSKLRIFQHHDRQNHGAGASRNLGIKHAQYELISFLDADDFYLNSRFKNDVEILGNNQNVDGVYNALGIHVHDESERERVNFELTTVKSPIPSTDLFEEMAPIGEGGFFHGDALTVRRNIFEKVGLFETRLKLSQDTYMWLKMAAKATLVPGIIDKPVAMRGVHAGNRIKNEAEFLYYRPFLFKYLLEWAIENNLPTSRKIILWNQFYKFYGKSVNARKSNLVSKRLKMFAFLIAQGVSNPYLFKNSEYHSAIIKTLSLKNLLYKH